MKACGIRLAVAALLPLLGGCVAVAALPVLAGGAMLSRGGADKPSGNPSAMPAERTRGEPAAMVPVEAVPVPAAVAPRPLVSRLTNLTELPPPSGAPGSAAWASVAADSPSGGLAVATGPWQAFVQHALVRAARPGTGQARSALLEEPASLAAPRFAACDPARPAVIVDLDPGAEVFAPAPASRLPHPGDVLQPLRAAGIEVVWISRQTAERAADVSAALRQAGLDPGGGDTLVLATSPLERKQVLRTKAGAGRCIVAIAGDQPSDFDELFDYLRDPASAAAHQTRLGASWFLVPPPLG